MSLSEFADYDLMDHQAVEMVWTYSDPSKPFSIHRIIDNPFRGGSFLWRAWMMINDFEREVIFSTCYLGHIRTRSRKLFVYQGVVIYGEAGAG
jgi:hypothetical protein